MLNFDWSNFLNEKSMTAPEWPGRVKIHQSGVSKILNIHTSTGVSAGVSALDKFRFDFGIRLTKMALKYGK